MNARLGFYTLLLLTFLACDDGKPNNEDDTSEAADDSDEDEDLDGGQSDDGDDGDDGDVSDEDDEVGDYDPFSDVIAWPPEQFATATNANGQIENLQFTFYELAEDDRNERPVVILLPGGGFTRLAYEDIVGVTEAFLREGFVVFTHDYRVVEWASLASLEGYAGAIIDAVHDHKAFIRHVRHAASGDNTYRINGDHIIAAGHSAGAVTALHSGFMDEDDVAQNPIVEDAVIDRGGLEGTVGGLGGVTRVDGIVNLAGGLNTATMIDADEPWLLSIHGDADQVVPIDVLEFGSLKLLEGSELLHERADAVGLENELIVIEGGDHGIPTYCEDCREMAFDFIFSLQ